MSDPEKKILCGSHGERVATFVCQHLVRGSNRGFHAGFDPEFEDDPFPDAWCNECEEKLSEVGGEWDDESEAFADIKVICADCYLTVRLRNQGESERRRFTFKSLQDIEEMHREAPRTFSIPRSDERKNLSNAQVVKLVFELAEKEPGLPGAERMWVEVTEKLSDGTYRGSLQNQPYFIASIQEGSEIMFGPQHVAAVYVKKDDGTWLDESLMVSCSERVTKEDEWPTLVVRESSSPTHTGWQVYAKDPSERVVPRTAEEVLNQFPVLDSVLGEEVGSTWRWDQTDLEYKRVK